MMMSFFTAVVLLAVTGGEVSGADPTKCCSDRQFEARLAEIGGALYNHSGHQVPSLMDVDNILHYDFYNRTVVYEVIQRGAQGRTVRSRIVHDFISGLRYVIKDNKCTYVKGSRIMTEQCIPDNAKFLGRSTFGSGVNSVSANNWQYHSPSANITIKSSVAASNCVPLVQATFSTLGHDASNDVVFIVTGFRPGIHSPTVFDIPANCVQQTSDGTQLPADHTTRGARYIDAVLSRGD
ncbi:ependymin-related protein 2-like [Haliotis rubra]|uniref:ependymin-related protein 2-like n=1 Tax=Haliotis rubra TaxID=36100 RepID=UPI001EE55C5C|nr:ependymin-related protein 2-like [Haliotis rubra]